MGSRWTWPATRTVAAVVPTGPVSGRSGIGASRSEGSSTVTSSRSQNSTTIGTSSPNSHNEYEIRRGRPSASTARADTLLDLHRGRDLLAQERGRLDGRDTFVGEAANRLTPDGLLAEVGSFEVVQGRGRRRQGIPTHRARPGQQQRVERPGVEVAAPPPARAEGLPPLVQRRPVAVVDGPAVVVPHRALGRQVERAGQLLDADPVVGQSLDREVGPLELLVERCREHPLQHVGRRLGLGRDGARCRPVVAAARIASATSAREHHEGQQHGEGTMSAHLAPSAGTGAA